ncbi:MAG TPA: S53 family peptidase [Mycobacteriales bacterium]|nr:S53 family peptidase [Mycobacteriales bacterium]
MIDILRSCALPAPGRAACMALVRAHKLTYSDGTVKVKAAAATPTGYGPSDLRSAYNLSASGGSGQTVAIVDAFDDPTAEADLATYRSQFGLPACTTANGCFRKVNQTGGSTPPSVDTGWAQEISLDLDMVSAICPNCHILLVEANSASISNLAAAVNEAVALGATEVSNSYGGSETSSETATNSAYNHAGVAITASAGDSGYGVSFPAASPNVTAVGGTSLSRASNSRGWSETVWGSSGFLGLFGASGTGSGCSSYEPKPTWQHDAQCAKRTVADVSAVADPNTGVAVYDSTPNSGQSGWLEFGGTSVSSPIIASVYALAGNAASVDGASFAYSHTSSLNDVTSGSNGSCTGGLLGLFGNAAKAYLCTGEVGYDGPTGLGTPNGTGAF